MKTSDFSSVKAAIKIVRQQIEYYYEMMKPEESLVTRLRIRADIRRQIPTRKSVQEGKPDRLADLLEEAANEIERLEKLLGEK